MSSPVTFFNKELFTNRRLNIKAVLFDLDGTLITFKLDYAGVRRSAFVEIKRSGIDTSNISENLSLYVMLKKIKKNIDQKTYSKLKNALWGLLEIFEMKAARQTELQPMSKEILDNIRSRGLKLALVTNNGRKATNTIFERFHINGYFDVVVTREDADEIKPDGGSIKKAIEFLDIEPEGSIMVGDSVIDISAAKKVGVQSVALPTGVSSLEKLIDAEPDYIIASLGDLRGLLEIL